MTPEQERALQEYISKMKPVGESPQGVVDMIAETPAPDSQDNGLLRRLIQLMMQRRQGPTFGNPMGTTPETQRFLPVR